MGFGGTAYDFFRNARVVRNSLEYATLVPDWFRSRQAGGDDPNVFAHVHTYVMFIGIGRSGTTLVGSLLDAHPRVLIANQQTTLKYLRVPAFTRERIFALLARNSRHAARGGRVGGGGYGYAVPGQWQGRHQRLEVIGDKSRSAQDVTWLTSRPVLLDDLVRVIGTRIRMIHVIRNPFDTIATRSLRRGVSLERITREYFSLCNRLQTLIARVEAPSAHDVARIPVVLEEFVTQPASQLAALCAQLGVDAPEDYLRDCAAIVRSQPHRSRHNVAWKPHLVAQIQAGIDRTPFLRRYSFDS